MGNMDLSPLLFDTFLISSEHVLQCECHEIWYEKAFFQLKTSSNLQTMLGYQHRTWKNMVHILYRMF